MTQTFIVSRAQKSLSLSLLVVIISALALIINPTADTKASDASNTVTIKVNTVCSFSVTTDVPHNGTVSGGQETTNIGQSTFRTICNDPHGYSVYAIGYTNDEAGNTNLVYTTDPTKSFTIPTGIASSDPTVSYWNMHLSSVPGISAPTILNNFSSSHSIPSSYTEVVSLDGPTENIVAASAFTSTYDVYASTSQVAGTYTGKVRYLLVHPEGAPAEPTITWNANGGTVSPTTSTLEFGSPLGTLPTPTYDGYIFVGWFTEATGGEEVTESTVVEGDTIYYAHWELPPTLADITYMQEITPEICAATPTPLASDGNATPQYQLEDTRDNKLYWVAKLADGNCWMTQNLDYNIKADGTDEIATIGSTTTSTWATSSTYPPQATSTTLSSNGSAAGTYSWDPGDYYIVNGYSSSACTTWRPDNTCEGTTPLSYSLTSTEAKDNLELHYHLGNYYQWNAATAGTGGTITDADASSSICPKGWRLPTSNSSDNYSFAKLTNAYSANGTKILSSPLWFVRSGGVYDGSLFGQGNGGGVVWASRAYSDTSSAYSLVFDSSSVDPSYDDYRDYGYSVRCVAE